MKLSNIILLTTALGFTVGATELHAAESTPSVKDRVKAYEKARKKDAEAAQGPNKVQRRVEAYERKLEAKKSGVVSREVKKHEGKAAVGAGAGSVADRVRKLEGKK